MRNVLAWVAAATAEALRRRAALGDHLPAFSSADSAGRTDSLILALRADYGLIDGPDGQLKAPAPIAGALVEIEPDLATRRLIDLTSIYGLDSAEAALLTVLVAAELDGNLSRAFDILTGTASGRVTIGLALELCGVPSAGAESVTLLAPSGALMRHRLLSAPDDAVFLRRPLRAPDRVVAHLAGREPGGSLRDMQLQITALPSDAAERLARGIEADATLTWIRSPLGASGLSVAAAAFGVLNIGWIAVDLGRRPLGVDPLGAAEAAVLEASLAGLGLIVSGAEALADGTDGGRFAVLSDARVPVIAVSPTAWRHHWTAGSSGAPLTIDAPVLTPRDRELLWRWALPELFAAGGELDSDPDAREALATLRLAPEEVAETARQAMRLGASRGEKMSVALVRDAARVLGAAANADKGAVARRSSAVASFEDLVLPEQIADELHRLVAWARHRDEVVSRGDVHGKAGKGVGLAALFTGSPGTGKTLAAHVVADELGLELFQVDLSGVVDKYIGETEKNLERIFHDAESRNLVLFFDEADALFGTRSSVKDARDRYANQEVSYLLQRMEHYDGITILATNLRGNLDAAFTRRMQFLVHFPDPDADTRMRLWEQHLLQAGELDPDDPIDTAILAKTVELAGGDIRNIVLGAAYDAISAGQTVGMRHLRAATVREFRKLSRRVPPAFE
jgi:hypothetical protein